MKIEDEGYTVLTAAITRQEVVAENRPNVQKREGLRGLPHSTRLLLICC